MTGSVSGEERACGMLSVPFTSFLSVLNVPAKCAFQDKVAVRILNLTFRSVFEVGRWLSTEALSGLHPNDVRLSACYHHP